MCHLMREPDDRLADADVLAKQIVSKHLCANTQILFCHKYLNTLAGERGQQKASFEYFAKSRSYLNISGQKHFGIILKFNSQILQSCHSMNIPWNFQTESIFLPFEVRFRQRGEWRHHLTLLPPTTGGPPVLTSAHILTLLTIKITTSNSLLQHHYNTTTVALNDKISNTVRPV